MAVSGNNTRAGLKPFLSLGGGPPEAGKDAGIGSSGVGTLLCATRMRMSHDLQRIAEVLHIRYTYLVAIEDGRYEDLPGQAYAIGFVRAYADYLGLDGDEIVRRYKEESSGVKIRTVFEFPMPTPDSGIPSGALILAAIVFGMVVYGTWYSIAGSDRDAVQVIQEVPDRLTALLKPGEATPSGNAVAAPATPAEKPEQISDVAEEAQAFSTAGTLGESAPVIVPAGAPPGSESSSENAAPTGTQTAAVPPVGSEPPKAASPPASSETTTAAITPVPVSVVELRAKSDLWVTLRAREKADRTQFLRKGEVYRIPEDGMTLVTGTPGDLEILVNGVVMPPLDAGVFARGVALDPQHLKGGAATQ